MDISLQQAFFPVYSIILNANPAPLTRQQFDALLSPDTTETPRSSNVALRPAPMGANL